MQVMFMGVRYRASAHLQQRALPVRVASVQGQFLLLLLLLLVLQLVQPLDVQACLHTTSLR